MKRQSSRFPNNSFTENASELDSDSLSDDADGGVGTAPRSDDEECFLDCEPAQSGSLEAFERSSSVPSTRQGSLPPEDTYGPSTFGAGPRLAVAKPLA